MIWGETLSKSQSDGPGARHGPQSAAICTGMAQSGGGGPRGGPRLSLCVLAKLDDFARLRAGLSACAYLREAEGLALAAGEVGRLGEGRASGALRAERTGPTPMLSVHVKLDELRSLSLAARARLRRALAPDRTVPRQVAGIGCAPTSAPGWMTSFGFASLRLTARPGLRRALAPDRTVPRQVAGIGCAPTSAPGWMTSFGFAALRLTARARLRRALAAGEVGWLGEGRASGASRAERSGPTPALCVYVKLDDFARFRSLRAPAVGGRLPWMTSLACAQAYRPAPTCARPKASRLRRARLGEGRASGASRAERSGRGACTVRSRQAG